MEHYSFLEPIKIGNVVLKNRIVLAAMAKYLCTDDGFITDEYVAHYAGIAKGGAALVTTGIMPIDSSWPYISRKQPYLSDDKYIPGLKKTVDAVHQAGGKIVFQPWHAGEAGTGISINSFTIEDIRRIQDQYAAAAIRIKKSGADGVEFHIAHTYLPCQFMSPYFNKRTDEYGSDTIENAMRFSLECIERIQKECCKGSDFFITAKVNGSDFVDGGTTPEWAAAGAVLLEKAGVAMITVNGGGAMTTMIGMSDDGRQKEGWKIPFARTVKNAVSIPVAGCGSLRHPAYVDQIIKNGDCDLAAIARGLYAEPEWVNKAACGREDEIRNCISCMFCFTAVEKGVSGCSVNPFAKRDLEKTELAKDGAGRTVAIIGAGPSGLEAAATLAERDFRPVIFEQNGAIGGLVALAALPPGKQKLGWLCEYYEKQIKRLGIDLRLNTEATKEVIGKLNPYAVILAAGSKELLPPIDGIDGENVISARQILSDGKAYAGKEVVMLGGGLTGLETARLLKEQRCQVTVLEMLPENSNPNTETKLALADAREDGVTLKFHHKALRIESSAVIAQDTDSGLETSFAADLVVLSLGIQPNDVLLAELKEICEKVIPVGDSALCGKISTAVQSGSAIGFAL